MNRKDLLESAEEYAEKLGWTDVEMSDEGSSVMMLLNAEGATEQMVAARLSRLRKELNELGGPENYPALEEYDVEEDYEAAKNGGEPEESDDGISEPDEWLGDEPGSLKRIEPGSPWDTIGYPAHIEDELGPCAKLAAEEAEAADHKDDAEGSPVPELPDPALDEAQAPPDSEEEYPDVENFPNETVTLPAEIIERAQEELDKEPTMNPREMSKPELLNACRDLGLTLYSGLNKNGLIALVVNAEKVGLIEDVSPNGVYEGVSPKEAATTPNPQVSQDRGGVPHPKQLFEEDVKYAPEGKVILARKNGKERLCSTSIDMGVKEAWEDDGWNFFLVDRGYSKIVAAAKAGDDVTIDRNTGKVHFHKVGDRVVANDGYRIRVTDGTVTQQFKSVNPTYWRRVKLDNGQPRWKLSVVRA